MTETTRLLVATVQKLAGVRSTVEMQQIVSAAARQLVGADGATFVLRDGDFCHYVDEDAIEPLWKGQRFLLETCISGWAMLNHQVAVIPDVYLDSRIPHQAYRPTFVTSLVMVPIRAASPLGAIGAYWSQHHQATSAEVELLRALAETTAVALESVRARDELELARLETLRRLALAAEHRDDDTYEHTARVAFSSYRIAKALGWGDEEAALLRQAASLHDIGKLAVPDSVLLKPGPLTSDEFDQIKLHPAAGAAMLAGSRSDALQLAEKVALTHHERWDGSGYPGRLQGREIPEAGRIVAVADVFDSLTHARPYKHAWDVPTALREIESLEGKQFDPVVVAAFNTLDPYELLLGSTAHHDT